MTSGIYVITNTINGRQYVGSTVRLETRWCLHRHDAQRGRQSEIARAIRQFGPLSFKFEILEKCERAELELRESYYIEALNTRYPNGYNLSGFKGGTVPKVILDAMPPEAREQVVARIRNSAAQAAPALRQKRTDPEYEAEYLKIKSAACYKREAGIRERRALDPAEDAKHREGRSRRSRATYARAATDPELAQRLEVARGKASETFRGRMKDPEYAARISEARRRAGQISWEKRRANRA